MSTLHRKWPFTHFFLCILTEIRDFFVMRICCNLRYYFPFGLSVFYVSFHFIRVDWVHRSSSFKKGLKFHFYVNIISCIFLSRFIITRNVLALLSLSRVQDKTRIVIWAYLTSQQGRQRSNEKCPYYRLQCWVVCDKWHQRQDLVQLTSPESLLSRGN